MTQEQNNLEQVITYDMNEKPKIKLTEINKIIINTSTQKEYDTLMQIYESANWNWSGKTLATEDNHWMAYKDKTCIYAHNNFMFNSTYNNAHNDRPSLEISLQQFCQMQKLTPNTLTELNSWFDTNKPNRKSKG
jgi:hypothetical protein